MTDAERIGILDKLDPPPFPWRAPSPDPQTLDTFIPATKCLSCGLPGERHDLCDRWDCPELRR